MKIRKSVFYRMDKLMPPDKAQEFLDTPLAELWQYNHGFGTMLRLKLLRPGSKLHEEFVAGGCHDRDLMTMLLMEEYHKYRTAVKNGEQVEDLSPL